MDARGLTPIEEKAIRDGIIAIGEISHPDNPEDYEPGLVALSLRVRAAAKTALLNVVAHWQARQIRDAFPGKSLRAIATCLGINPGSLSRQLSGESSWYESLMESYWIAQRWETISLPPMQEVNAAIFNAARETLVPLLNEAGRHRPVWQEHLGAEAIEVLGCIHSTIDLFPKLVQTGADRRRAGQYVQSLREHLVERFGRSLPPTALFAYGPSDHVLQALAPFYADWTELFTWVNRLLDYSGYRPNAVGDFGFVLND